jgi:Glycosyl transferases group 1
MAPFERGLDHGGSQRATAMAERLEERGAEVEWRTFVGRVTSPAAKLRAAAVLRPALVDVNVKGEPQPSGSFDAVIAAHSYLASHLDDYPPAVVRLIDFHNLEWRHLADNLSFASGLRALNRRLQVRLMRRFERRALRDIGLATFASATELAWSRDVAPSTRMLLVPSVLPHAAEQQALSVPEFASGGHELQLAYVGTVKFPPNLKALLHFLRESWPSVRRAVPGIRLKVAGQCAEKDRQLLSSFAGVEALGFVDDVRPLLAESAAVIMPIHGQAGTSLRALYYALAGVWVIGTRAAFRGLPWEMGALVDGPAEWSAAVNEAVEGSGDRGRRVEAARTAALANQHEPKPWDDLFCNIAELAQ